MRKDRLVELSLGIIKQVTIFRIRVYFNGGRTCFLYMVFLDPTQNSEP